MRKSLIILITILIPCLSHAIIRHVPDRYRTIQEAVNVTRNGDTVLVHPGIYEENIRIISRIAMIGSLYLITGDESYIDSTVINGDASGSVVLFRDLGEDEGGGLIGFTITNGYADTGGGVYIENSCPELRGCVIRDNSALYSGGGLSCIEGAYPILIDCIIDHNEILREGGGGIYVDNSGPMLSNCVISNNHSDVEAGGGLHNHNGITTLINCTITGNWADGSGGAVWCTGEADINMINCLFWDNTMLEILLFDNNHLSISYSNVEGGEERIIAYENARITWGGGSMNADPLFVDFENGDYHLQAHSPCIDAGHPRYQYDPDNSIRDIGKYWFDQRPNLVVDPEAIEFEPYIGDYQYVDVTITNSGTRPLGVQSITTISVEPQDVFAFRIRNPSQPFALEYDETHQINLAFSPPFVGDFRGVLRIVSNDPDNQEAIIPINGTALNIDATPNRPPLDFGISTIFPNPFNSTTRIGYTVSTPGRVSLNVIDIYGNEILSLVDDFVHSGSYGLTLTADKLPAGLYFIHLSGRNDITIKKMVVIR
ncbi:MAG: right-handed parallel beta-helix repeat-containing protein [Candidatus Hatepunaea meridiana]|nr:right-handed parallel beta-helix repeat-containing protein [Candidatus Hatepunaea meridiana]